MIFKITGMHVGCVYDYEYTYNRFISQLIQFLFSQYFKCDNSIISGLSGGLSEDVCLCVILPMDNSIVNVVGQVFVEKQVVNELYPLGIQIA